MDQNNVKKSLSLWDTTAIIVGIVIGAGIFKFPTLVAMNVTSEWMLYTVWALGGFVSLVGALTYAELATTYPHSGGDYHFLQRAYGDKLSFLFAWTRMLIIQPGSIVLMAFIVGEELTKYFSLGMYSHSLYAAITVALFTFLNYAGIREGKSTQKILSFSIFLGLIFLVVISFAASDQPFQLETKPQTLSGFGLAMVFVLLTFGGWNESAYISAEIKEPRKNMIRSLLLGIGSITALYLLVNYALLSTLGLKAMASFDAPQKLVEMTLGKYFVPSISFILLIAALSTINATIITGGRSNYALAKDYQLFSFMNQWDDNRQSPSGGLLFQAVISFALIIIGTINKSGLTTMVDYTAPAFWFFFALTGISLFILRKKDAHLQRNSSQSFSVPLYPVTPILFVLAALFMLQSSIAYTGKGGLLSIGVVLIGLIPLLLSKRV